GRFFFRSHHSAGFVIPFFRINFPLCSHFKTLASNSHSHVDRRWSTDIARSRSQEEEHFQSFVHQSKILMVDKIPLMSLLNQDVHFQNCLILSSFERFW